MTKKGIEASISKQLFDALDRIEKLGTDYPVHLGTCEANGSNQLETDVFRKFTLKEYLSLGNAIKSVGKHYNKKLDKIIDIK